MSASAASRERALSRSASTNMAFGGALSLARLLSGLVRIKVVALSLGVAGVGVFSLLQQVSLTGIAIVSVGLAVPIINLGRPSIASGAMDQAGAVAGTALAMVAINAFLLLVAAAIAGAAFFGQIGIGTLDPFLLWPVAVAIVIGAFSSSFWEGMSFLSDRFDIYVRVGIFAAIADMIVTATCAWLFGLRGAIMAMPASAAALVGAYAFLLSRDVIARQVLRHLSVDFGQLPRLIAYSAMMFGTAALTNLGLTAMRARVLLEAGAQANGYLQTATSMSAYILAFVTTGFWGHMHARAAAEGDTPAIRAELHQALRLGLLIAFSGCGAAAVLAPWLIPLFYSGQFSGGVELMVAYMPGELCFQFLFVLTAYQLTISRRRRYLGWSVGYIVLLAGIGFLAIPRFGAAGYVAAHIGSSALMLGVAVATCWRSGQLKLSLLALAAAFITILAAICGGLFYLHERGEAGLVTLIALVPFAVTGALAVAELLGARRWRLDRRAA
jgi:PST family polysaccharide transporter